MKKSLLPIICIFSILIANCGSTKYTPTNNIDVIRYIDSIVWHDSIIYKEVIKERIVDIVPIYDTLKLETSLAKSTSYVDTSLHIIKGILENKDTTLPVEIKWKEHIIIRDSIQTKEVPVEVEVVKTKYPKTYWWLLGFAILTVLIIAIKIYIKIIK